MNSAAKNGIRFGLHSDCPVTPVNPFHSMWTAVTRQTKTGEILGSDECISVKQAGQEYIS